MFECETLLFGTFGSIFDPYEFFHLWKARDIGSLVVPLPVNDNLFSLVNFSCILVLNIFHNYLFDYFKILAGMSLLID